MTKNGKRVHLSKAQRTYASHKIEKLHSEHPGWTRAHYVAAGLHMAAARKKRRRTGQ